MRRRVELFVDVVDNDTPDTLVDAVVDALGGVAALFSF